MIESDMPLSLPVYRGKEEKTKVINRAKNKVACRNTYRKNKEKQKKQYRERYKVHREEEIERIAAYNAHRYKTDPKFVKRVQRQNVECTDVRENRVKVCGNCHKLLPFMKFTEQSKLQKYRKTVKEWVDGEKLTKDGHVRSYNLRSYCIDCKSKMNKEYYEKRKAKTQNKQT